MYLYYGDRDTEGSGSGSRLAARTERSDLYFLLSPAIGRTWYVPTNRSQRVMFLCGQGAPSISRQTTQERNRAHIEGEGERFLLADTKNA